MGFFEIYGIILGFMRFFWDFGIFF